MARREETSENNLLRFQLAAIVESSDDAIIGKTLDGVITSWNAGAERLYGYPASEIIGQSISWLVPPDQVDELPNICACIRRGEAVRPYITERVTRDGRRVSVSLSVSPVRNDKGEIVGASAIARDVTASMRQAAEHAELFLREQAARLEAERAAVQLQRLQSITDAALANLKLDDLLRELLERIRQVMEVDFANILLLDGEMLVVRASSGLGGEFGRGLQIPLGQGFAGRVAAAKEAIIITNASISDVFSPLLIEKGIKSLLGVPLTVEGVVTGVLHVSSLRTRQFTEDESRLLQLAADRVALSIDRARLFAELQEADSRKNDFMAMVAHELRTPLFAISNAVYILENIQLPDERAGRQLGTVNRQTRQLARLVEDLMDISRITRGSIELRTEAVSIQKIVMESVSAMRPLMEARGQDLATSLPDVELWVQGDPARLEQIITNLLGNAVKYTEPGGSVWLTLEGAEGWVIIKIRDTGIGVDPPLLPQIFDLFHQVDPGASRTEGGLGIGLALVKRLAEMHGGTVSASSDGVGTGTEFIVRLPLLKSDS
ncbi:MAG: PAS domain-containing sensor histidine kinase, partial [Armatimonadota bacterium]|nr:PAS domain-containing sensor histidine kinase [Armatimonadota bacterium]